MANPFRASRLTYGFRLILLALLCATIPASLTYAEPGVPMVRGSKIRDYARITFNWPEKVRFSANAKGNVVTVRFDRRAEPDFGGMLSQLRPHVMKVSVAEGGKALIITLDKPYRIRTFISGNSSGLDLLNIGDTQTADAAKIENQTPTPPVDSAKEEADKAAAKQQALKEKAAKQETAKKEALEKAKKEAKAKEKRQKELAAKERQRKQSEEKLGEDALKEAARQAEILKAQADKEEAARKEQKQQEIAAKALEKTAAESAKQPVTESVQAPSADAAKTDEKRQELAAMQPGDTLSKVNEEKAKQAEAAPPETPAAPQPSAESAAAPQPEPVAEAPSAAPTPATEQVEKNANAPETAPQQPSPVASSPPAAVSSPEAASGSPPPTQEAKAIGEMKQEEAAKPASPATASLTAGDHEPLKAIPPVSEAAPEKKIETPAAAPAPAVAEAPPVAPATQTLSQPQKPITVTPTSGDVKGEKLFMTVTAGKDGPELHFPWKQRVGATVFRRGSHIWIVFSQSGVVDFAALQQAPIPGIESVEQLPAGNYTVMRLAAAPKITPIVSKMQDSFEWVVTLSPKRKRVKEVLPIQVNTAPPLKPHVVVPVLESSEPLTMIDPEIGTELTITPFYKPGQGISPGRRFVEFGLLDTAQGMVLEKFADNTRVVQLRNGLKITVPGGLSLTSNMPPISPDELDFFDEDAPTLFPYSQWKLANDAEFIKKRQQLSREIAAAPPEKAQRLRLKLTQLYLGQGFAQETLGVLDQIKQKDAEFYSDRKLAAYRGAANFLLYRLNEAQADFSSPELADVPEMELWRDVVGELLGSPTRQFNYLAYNKDFILYYPPAIRQKLAIIAADAAINQRNYNIGMATFDSLNKDNLLIPMQKYVDFMLAKVSSETGQEEGAMDIWKKLTENLKDNFIRARAEYSLVALQLQKGKITTDEAIKRLDQVRVIWRGDNLEMNVLSLLGRLYIEKKDYINGLRALRDLVTNFPDTPDALAISQQMAAIFNLLFNQGEADKLPPLDALSLYYEFRELTPVGSAGDKMIQKLADRLVGVDLLDRAAALLNHQVRFRLEGEERSRVGARLALIYLLAKEPRQALGALELTSYGANPPDLQRTRNQLAAQALSDLGDTDKALSILADDESDDGRFLKVNIYWGQKDWPNVITSAEALLARRKDITAPLTQRESDYLLKLALAYVFEHDSVQLQYLRDYFGPLMADNPNKTAFFYITDNSGPVDPENFQQVTRDISRIQSFIDTYQTRIHKEGLSSAVN